MLRLLPLILVCAMGPALVADDKPQEAEKPAETTTQPTAQEPAAQADDGLRPHVKMETTMGDIVIELHAKKTPVTVDNFLRYAEEGYYTGTVFHRVMNDFMIQGGGFTAEMDEKTAGLRAPIKNEWQTGLKNLRGAIAMARKGGDPDSATAQFFINVVDNPRLDRAQRDGAGYCAFGRVVEGMPVVDKIRNTAVRRHPKYRAPDPRPVTPIKPIIIKSIKPVGQIARGKIAALAKAAAQAADEAKRKARAEREKKLNEYVEKLKAQTNAEVIKTDSGLMYIVIKEGEGPTPKPSDQVEIHYVGTLLDGTKFDSSIDRGEPAVFALSAVIPGFSEGVGMMKVGGKHKLIVPPELGYGSQALPAIPANSFLVFEVELLAIK